MLIFSFLLQDDDSETATEGEEEVRARELRRQEVRLEAPELDTGSDTEVNTSSDNELSPIPPDVIPPSPSSDPELLTDIPSTTTTTPTPTPRRKRNSFRIAPSTLSKSQVNDDSPVIPPRLSAGKTRLSRTNQNVENTLAEQLSELRLSDRYKAREKYFNNLTIDKDDANSEYGTPHDSPSSLTPTDPNEKISRMIQKVNTTPNSEKCIKSILATKFDKKSSEQQKRNPNHTKDCIVM